MPVFKTVDKQFFKNRSPQMAYVLGYFAADGSMLRNNRGAHFIEVCSIDKELIDTVQCLLKSNHRIALRNRFKPNQSPYYRLQIGSKEIYEDLIRLGMVPTKSNVLHFPNVPQELISHFVRGYFDGDGHVSIANYKRRARGGQESVTIISGFTSGSKDFLEKLLNKLKKYANISGGSLYYNKGYRLTFSVKDSKLLSDFLYRDAGNLHLKRKKAIFNKYYREYKGL